MASPRPGSEDRAWNDPPPLFPVSASNPQPNAPQPSGQRRILSKRVPYTGSTPAGCGDMPMTAAAVTGGALLPTVHDAGQVNTAVTPLVPPPPPTGSCTASKPPVDNNASSVGEKSSQQNSNDLIMQLLEKYKDVEEQEKCEEIVKIVDKCFSDVSSTLQKRSSDEVRKRIDMLKNCLHEKNLSSAVVNKLYCLAKALQEENYDNAHEVHLNLMMAHVSEVSHWMVGVKHVIQAYKDTSEEESSGQAINEPLCDVPS